MRVLNRRFTVKQTLHVHVGLCLPLPLGGWMHTMQEQPGRCLGCLVVAPADDSAVSTRFSPRAAAQARASKPDASCSWIDLLFSSLRRFLKSAKHSAQHKDLGIVVLTFQEQEYNRCNPIC